MILFLAAIIHLSFLFANSLKVIIGIQPSRLNEYQTEDLRCPSTGLKLTPDMINDGYCDCPEDGFDEPGTAACSKGKFYCANRPLKPALIPSSRVNDGVCDCCDGSDEYLNLFGNPCKNTCESEIRELKRSKYIQKAALKKAVKVANVMKLEAAKKRDEMQVQLTEIDTKLNEIKQKVESASQDIRNDPEAFEEFIQQYNQKIKELEDLISASQASNQSSTTNAEQKKPIENSSWSQMLGGKIARVKAILKGIGNASGPLTSTITQYIPTIVTKTIVMFEPSTSRDSRMNELEWEQQDLEMQAENLRHDLSKESFYGPDSIYIVFKDKCFNYDSASFQYSICWFQDASQSSPGNYVRLGNWKGWYEHSNGTVDYSKAQFIDGYRCGAVSREATLDLVCGLNNEIISASEPEPCKFLFKFTTPAACLN